MAFTGFVLGPKRFFRRVPYRAAVPLALAFWLSGCGVLSPLFRNTGNLQRLKLGDSKEVVLQKLGNPVRLEMQSLQDGTILESWKYHFNEPDACYKNLALGFFLMTLSWWIPLPQFQEASLLDFYEGRLVEVSSAGPVGTASFTTIEVLPTPSTDWYEQWRSNMELSNIGFELQRIHSDLWTANLYRSRSR